MLNVSLKLFCVVNDEKLFCVDEYRRDVIRMKKVSRAYKGHHVPVHRYGTNIVRIVIKRSF